MFVSWHGSRAQNRRMAWLSHVCDMTHHVCDMTHEGVMLHMSHARTHGARTHMSHMSRWRRIWVMHVCTCLSRSYVRRDSFACQVFVFWGICTQSALFCAYVKKWQLTCIVYFCAYRLASFVSVRMWHLKVVFGRIQSPHVCVCVCVCLCCVTHGLACQVWRKEKDREVLLEETHNLEKNAHLFF